MDIASSLPDGEPRSPPPLWTLHVKSMAGETLPISINADARVSELKRRVQEVRPECHAHRQRMVVMSDHGGSSPQHANPFAVLDNTRTLIESGLHDGALIELVVLDAFPPFTNVRAPRVPIDYYMLMHEAQAIMSHPCISLTRA